MTSKVKFFPWAPGIPWKMLKGKYVQPKIPVNHLLRLLKSRTLWATAYAGLLESYYALFLIETFHQLNPQQTIGWAGSSSFDELFSYNPTIKIAKEKPTQEDLLRFPTPIFFDKDNNAYLNYLNNYLNIESYYLTPGYPDSRLVTLQMMEKSCLPQSYWKAPVLNLPDLNEEQKFQTRSIDFNRPFIVVFPDHLDFSHHANISCLNWTPQMVNALAATLALKDVQVVVCPKSIAKYHGGQAIPIQADLSLIIYLIKHACGILSRDPDFLFVANHLSSGALFCDKMVKKFSIEENNILFHQENVIYEKQDLVPHDILQHFKENQ